MKLERWLLAAALTVIATPAVAQLQYSTTLDLSSNYTARGVTWTNRFVVQPSIEVSATRGANAITASVWGNVEPTTYDGPDDMSSRNGIAGPSELDISLELSRTMGPLELAVGTIWFVYPKYEPYAGGPNTIEATFSASLDVPLSPTFNFYYEAIAAPGVYAALSVSHEVPTRTPIALDAALGFSHGQADAHDHASYYAADGLTHFELGASMPISAGRFTVSPTLRGIMAIDDAVRVTGPTREQDFKVLLGASFSWSGPSR